MIDSQPSSLCVVLVSKRPYLIEGFHTCILNLDLAHLVLQFLGDGVDVNLEVLAQILAHVSVLHVTADVLCSGSTRAVDVDINCGMARGSKATCFVITGCNENSLGLALLDEVEDSSEGLVVLKNLVDLSGGIIDVTSMVDSAALNHDEEALVALLSSLLKSTKSSLGHFAQRRSEERQLHIVAALESIKTSPVISVGPVVLLLCNLDHVGIVSSAAALRAARQVVASTTTKHQVDGSSEYTLSDLLKSNLIFHFTEHNVRVEAGWSRILRRISLLSAGEGSGTGSAVGDKGAIGASPARAPKMLVEGEGIAKMEIFNVLSVAANSDDNNSGCSDQSPGKQAELTETQVSMGLAFGLGIGAVVTGPGQERIAFVGLRR
ncbi:hypothetical protein HG531_000548 [Fusarium graminearum]|nr:hypothetical protein HG531_000548 [Fusarium graminearum]